MHLVYKLISIAAIGALSACSSSPERISNGANDPDIMVDTAPGVNGGQNDGIEVIPAQGSKAGASGGRLGEAGNLDGMKMVDVDTIHEPIIYFKYDQYELDESSTEIVRYHANILLDNPKQKLQLTGHTDERGTPEYNLALGEKRALAVSQVMMLFGVSETRIDVVSFGEEQPAAQESNEQAWSKNRRVEIIIQ